MPSSSHPLWFAAVFAACTSSTTAQSVPQPLAADAARDAVVDAAVPCYTLDFDVDGRGAAIMPGRALADAYRALGVAIDVWRDPQETVPGLGVAFDSNHPTGGDTDLQFTDLGNLLISQGNFTPEEQQMGFVSEPNDDSNGAIFSFRFDRAACIDRVTVLDMDFGALPGLITLYNDMGTPFAMQPIALAGDNSRQDIAVANPDPQTCRVTRFTVCINESGAVDNLRFCYGRPPIIEEDARPPTGG